MTRHDGVQNLIVDALATRVIKAINDGDKFKLIVVIPNHPEGAVGETAINAVLHFQLLCLFSAPDSLRRRIEVAAKAKQLDWCDYLSVNCLRKHGEVGSQLVCNQIYVSPLDLPCVCMLSGWLLGAGT